MHISGSQMLHLVIKLKEQDAPSAIPTPEPNEIDSTASTPPLMFSPVISAPPRLNIKKPKIIQIEKFKKNSSKSEIHEIAVKIQSSARNIKDSAKHLEDILAVQVLLDEWIDFILALECRVIDRLGIPGLEGFAAVADIIKDTIANLDREIINVIDESEGIKLTASVVEYIAGMIAAHTADFTLDYFPPARPVYRHRFKAPAI